MSAFVFKENINDNDLSNLKMLDIKFIKENAILEALYPDASIIYKMFIATEIEINKSWSKVIKFYEILLNKIQESIKKNQQNIIINTEFKNIKAPFSGYRDKLRNNRKINSYKSIEDLYDGILYSYHNIYGMIINGSKIQKDLLESFKNSIDENESLRDVVNESHFKYFNFNSQDLPFVSDDGDPVNLVGEELFNQLFIENATIFNDVGLDEIFIGQEFQIKAYEKFLNKFIYNIAELVKPSSKYYKINEKLNAEVKIINVMLEIFLKEYKKKGINEISSTINLYSWSLVDFNNKESLDQLRYVLELIVLKSKVLTEVITNMLKLDIVALHIAEQKSIKSIRNVSIDELRKVKEIVFKHEKDIIKHDKCYLDFSKFKLGSVCMSDSARNEVYDKYVDFPYSTQLLYFIGKYKYTLISHGWIEYYGSIREFINAYKSNYATEFKLFKECYSSEIIFLETFFENKFENFTEKQCEQAEGFLTKKILDQVVEDPITRHNLLNFHASCLRRWKCDEIYIPFINKEIDDVEMMIYIMNKAKIDTLAVYICNKDNFVPNHKCISFYDNMEVTISNRKIVK